jgi:DNA-directed RNA polymerase specialized sigma subunit
MDAKEEDRLVRKYMQLARCAAARTYRKWGERLDEGELVGEAMLILLEAIRGFDPEISSNGWDGLGPRISWLLSVRLCDYVRQKLGRNGQRMALTFARTGEDLRLLHRQRTYGESSQRIAEWEAEEVIEKLLSRLPGKRGLVMRCLLRHDFGPDGVKEAMRLAELSESRVSQIRMESVAMLREMGLDKVLKILC